MKRCFYLLATLAALCPAALASTINIGAVGLNTTTGYYLSADGSFNTNGQILVGYFSLTEAQLKTLIAGWGDTAVLGNTNGTVTQYSPASYDHYTNLVSYFTQIGTGGAYGSGVAGWSFNSNGTVAGTSLGVDTSVLPANTQLYVLAINTPTSNLTTNGFSSSTQWGLYTGQTNWLAPASGGKSLNLSQVEASGVLIGTDLGSLATVTSNSVMMAPGALPSGSGNLDVISGNLNLSTGPVTVTNVFLGNASISGSGTLTFSSFTATNSSAASVSAPLSGPGSLIAAGTGTLTLSAYAGYTGVTTLLQNARLLLAPTASLAETAGVGIGAGASLLLGAANQVNSAAPLTLGGTLSLGNGSTRAATQSFTTLTLTTNSVIDFASLPGTSTLTFTGDSNSLGGFTLSVWNWSASDRLVFSRGSGALSSGDLANITFYSNDGTSLVSGYGAAFNGTEIVPVPEPAAITAGLLLLGWLLAIHRPAFRAREASGSGMT